MKQMELSYLIAKTQTGISEMPGPNSNKKIIEYACTTTLKAIEDEISWCSAFVNWCYLIAGIIQNPASMRIKLTGLYSEQEIMMFYDSAIEIAGILNIQFDKIKSTSVPVKLPTRSAAAKSWLKFANESKTPKEGDIVVIWRESPDSWKAHVGFFVRKSDSFLDIFGGNQGNKICLAPFSKNRLLGYRCD